MSKFEKYESSTLLYTIIVAFIIFFILLSFIQLSFFTTRFLDREILKDKLSSNIYSALTVLIKRTDYLEKKDLILFENNVDKVEVETSLFGAFLIVKLSSNINNVKVEKRYLAGTSNEIEKFAIVLPERNNELTLSGNTSIKGNCILPKLGAKQGIIKGISFSGNKLIEGKISKSSNSFPKQNEKLIFPTKETLFNDSVIFYSDVENQREIIQKFNKKRITIYSKEKIIIDNKLICGNIIIKSEKGIKLESNSSVKDIILYAPYIEIKKKFNGNLQIFATDSVLVGENVKLNYPSFIGLFPDKFKENAKIDIKANSLLAGSILGLNKTKLLIADKVIIYGTIYNHYKTELNGRVTGTVITDRFALTSGVNEFMDVIQNGEIDNTKKPAFLASAFLFEGFKSLVVIKELE